MIEWGQLHHAYGAASDVPGRLADLRTGEWRAALAELSGNIYHQGTRWQASAHAVPVLVSIVDDPSTPCRPAVLGLG